MPTHTDVRSGNTNGKNFELFATVADADGSGMPLAYLLIKTEKGTPHGTKCMVLECFLQQLHTHGVNPEYTLSDKDFSEIKVFQTVWPHSKHQLCLWHGLHAVKQQVAKSSVTPAPYDVIRACTEFLYIKATFVPVAQQGTGQHVSQVVVRLQLFLMSLQLLPPPDRPIPCIQLLMDGCPSVLTLSLPTH